MGCDDYGQYSGSLKAGQKLILSSPMRFGNISLKVGQIVEITGETGGSYYGGPKYLCKADIGAFVVYSDWIGEETLKENTR